MLFLAPNFAVYIRVVALLSLLLGLNDASRLLGVNLGAVSPVTTMGLTAFIYLAVFCLARLVAAVGLWIRASWGAVILVGATILELALYVAGNVDVRMTVVGFAMRLVLLAAIMLIFGLSVRFRRAQTD